MKKKYTLSLLIVLLGLSTLFMLVQTFSWIKRDWSPSFYSDELLVETSGSLAIMLEDTNETYTEIDLNEILSLNTNFKLQQVSNYDGESDHFFKIDFPGGNESPTLLHLLKQSTQSYEQLGIANGYIEKTFRITCKTQSKGQTDYQKYVFIDATNSYIDVLAGDETSGYSAAAAIRVSLTIHGISEGGTGSSGSDVTYLFKKDKSTLHAGALSTQNADNTYVANGLPIFTDVQTKSLNTSAYQQNPDTYQFDDFVGGEVIDGEFQLTKRSLFKMSSIETRKITIRIWLEGYDTNCNDFIAGSKILFKLTLKSFDSIEEND